MNRALRLHTFCSVKGGVGKSSLSVVLAKLIARENRFPVVIDADFTGTSLADGLPLCAPRLSPDVSALKAAPSNGHLTWSETRALRATRATAKGAALRPPYLNDVLGYDPDLRPDAALWRHQQDDGVRYLPSSAILHDVRESLQWLDSSRAFDWVCRLAWLIDGLISNLPALTDVVVDLPPGVWGFAHGVMVLVSALENGRPMPEGYPPWQELGIGWTVNPFLVVTPDRNDLVPGLEYFARTLQNVTSLRPLLNRSVSSVDDLAKTLGESLGSPLADLGLHRSLVPVAEMQETIGKIFRTSDFQMDTDVVELKTALRIDQ